VRRLVATLVALNQRLNLVAAYPSTRSVGERGFGSGHLCFSRFQGAELTLPESGEKATVNWSEKVLSGAQPTGAQPEVAKENVSSRKLDGVARV